MSKLMERARNLRARAASKAFLFQKMISARLSQQKKLRILVSNNDWKKDIKMGFYLSGHDISFEDLKQARLEDFDLVVPLMISDLEYLDGVRDRIPGNPLPIPSLESVRLCDNKIGFNRRMVEKGFGELIPQMGGKQEFPYLLKKAVDAWGAHTYRISNIAQEREFQPLLEDPDYFTQALIQGEREFATHVVFKNGEIKVALNIEYVFPQAAGIKGKDEILYRGVSKPLYLDIFARILEAIDFEGLCCFNFKVVDDKPMIIEINPRFGGSLCPYFVSFVEHLE